MLEVDLTCKRGRFRLDISAAFAGRALGVFGPSGAGKTTFLHALAGLIRPDAGRVVLDGRVLTDTASRTFVPAYRRRVGVVFQDNRLLPNRTVGGNLEYGWRCQPSRRRRFAIDEVAEMVEVAHLLDRPVGGLSGGEARRVAIGRAILAGPDLLLLDEPYAGLDAPLAARLAPCIARSAEATGIPMVLVSHDLRELLVQTDQLLVIDRGCSIGQGAYVDLLARPRPAELLAAGGLSNALHLTVAEHLPREGMTACTAATAEGDHAAPAVAHRPASPRHRRDRLKVPYCPSLAVGSEVVASIRGDDCALATAPVEHISMQNQLPGTLQRLEGLPHAIAAVVDTTLGTWVVEATPQTVADLDLRPGMRAWVLSKARSIRLAGGAAAADRPTPGRGENPTDRPGVITPQAASRPT